VAFRIIPAIDIQGGKAVRLRQGRADEATVYADNPVDVAKRFADDGATTLHVIDLDGAFTGKPVNADIIRRIVSAVDIPVQVGGGIRNDEIASRYLGLGVARVILGTSVVRNPEEVLRITKAYPGQVAASLDAKDGKVAIRGWVEVTGVDAIDLARTLVQSGIACFIYTDIARDGMMAGPNFVRIREFAGGVSVPVIASGGVTTIADIELIQAMEPGGVEGVIIGRAMYDGSIRLEDALKFERL
jgi:phosphoribosylformimino-5-aminoimidazole carboxamide ribotide isomerase